MRTPVNPVELQTEIVAQFPGVQLELRFDPVGDLVIDKIVVPAERRERGVGSLVMDRIVAAADAAGARLALTPTGDFGGSVTRLRRFYRRWGFADNTGRSRDFTTRQAMLREPDSGR
ncbi:hypothetical protein GS896_25680 [Rhodococcus hoagii]|nr:hypothetical protein [Prescottella equi]MBM4654103.1 hypothetical protein [Prescottella equi]MBM4719577.1 hypothetical protein [Prescottella equi]NKR23376.1 hypothetical protein [Prescottella equi]NKT56013.1 hypothetical protein [Prescottella equi]